MGITKHTVKTGQKPTKEQIEEIKRAKAMAPVFDDDSPELTEEQIKQFKQLVAERRENRNKQSVSIRLSPQTIKKAKALGKGYSSVLSRIVEFGLNDPEILKRCL